MKHALPVFCVTWTMLACVAAPPAPSTETYPVMHIGDTLGAHQAALRYFEPQADEVLQTYTSAFNILASRPDASFGDVAQDAAFQKLCSDSRRLLLGGPMLGSLTPSGATLWVRTARPAEVKVVIRLKDEERTYGPVKSTAASDLTAWITVTNLPPNSVCPYSVTVDGVPASPQQATHCVIRTCDEASPQTRIIFGSCFHSRIGTPELMASILERKPHACLFIGDIAADDKRNHFGLLRADYLLRDFHPAWRNLVAQIPVYAAWDDHDYYDNDASGIPRGATEQDMKTLRQLFIASWNNPCYGAPEQGKGIYSHTRIGAFDVILLDTRSLRASTKREPDAFLGKEQTAWLKKTLLACKGRFIILSSGTMWSDYVSKGKDSWGVWDPEGREALFSFIEANQIPGVLLISGDRHGARGFKIPRPSGYTFYEFEAASLGGWTGPEKGPGGAAQLYGVLGTMAFGEFTCDATPADPTVTFTLRSRENKTLYELTLTRSQLMPK